jgi:methyl-accepting chemotaxis protein
MNFIKKSSIRAKIIGVAAAAVIMVIAISAFNFISSSSVNKSSAQTKDESVVFAMHARDFELAVVQVQQWLTDISATRGAEGYDDGFDEAESNYLVGLEKLAEFEKMFLEENDTELLAFIQDLRESFTSFYEMGKTMAQTYIKYGPARGNDMMEKFDPFAAAIAEKTDQLVQSQLSELDASMSSILAQTSLGKSIAIVATVLVPALMIVFGLFLVRSIINPLNSVTAMTQDIATGEGDLTKWLQINEPQPCSEIMQCGHSECPAYGRTVECWVEVGSFSENVHCPKIIEGVYQSCHECKVYHKGSYAELGELSNWFNTFVARIRGLITKVKENATGVSTASGQIASASEQLAAGSEEQQSQLSEVATTMEEMSAMILESSKNADETRQNAQTAGQTAGTGRETVTKTVTGFQTVANTVERAAGQIQELSTRSEEIGNVIQVIDEIADQTNLLALNANIEAARAGEAGRGFAVVADEVRKLAERTVSATGEIGKMIESIQGDISAAVESMTEIQTQSKDGLEQVQQSDSALEEISGSVGSVVTAVEQIASAANEQSSGAEEVSKNIEGVSTVSKQSASSAQELAASAEQLNKEIQSMNELIGQFKVE